MKNQNSARSVDENFSDSFNEPFDDNLQIIDTNNNNDSEIQGKISTQKSTEKNTILMSIAANLNIKPDGQTKKIVKTKKTPTFIQLEIILNTKEFDALHAVVKNNSSTSSNEELLNEFWQRHSDGWENEEVTKAFSKALKMGKTIEKKRGRPLKDHIISYDAWKLLYTLSNHHAFKILQLMLSQTASSLATNIATNYLGADCGILIEDIINSARNSIDHNGNELRHYSDEEIALHDVPNITAEDIRIAFGFSGSDSEEFASLHK